MSYEQIADVRCGPLGNWSTDARVRPSETELAMEAGKLLEDVRVALKCDLGAATKAAARLAALLGRDRIEKPRSLPARGGLAPWQKRKVQDHIERHIESAILLDDLAKLVSLSGSHFCRAFKESFADTPHAYIMRMRVARAQELMLTTSEPLSQIAIACGLADQAHLTRLFRQTMGEAPRAWRRSHAVCGWPRLNRGADTSARGILPDRLARIAAAG